MIRRLAAVLFALVLVLGPASAAGAVSASTDDFTFDSFTGDYYLSRDTNQVAQLYVVETLVAAFPEFDQNKGLVRTLPKVQSGIDLDTEVISVTGADGGPVSWWTEEDDDWIYVLTGDDTYVHGAQEYTFTYTMSNVVIRFADTNADEFYWDTVGSERPQPIDDVSLTVHLTASIATGVIAEQTACYQGPEGSTETCDIVGPAEDQTWSPGAATWASWHGASASGAQAFTVSTGPLAADENVTVAIGFTQGTFAAPSPPPAEPIAWAKLILPFAVIALGVFGPIGLLVLRRYMRRNPDPSPVVVQYTPAEESLTLSAAMLNQPGRALAASVVDLAVRDVIEIHGSGDRRDPRDFTLSLTTLDGLDADDRTIIEILFGRNAAPGARMNLGHFTRNTPRRAATYLSGVDESAVRSGYATRVPQWITVAKTAMRWVPLGLAWLLLGVFEVLREGTGTVGGVVILAAIVIGVLCPLVSGWIRLPSTMLTMAGGMHVHELDGIREYLELAEEDRLTAAQAADTADLVSSGRRAYGDDSPGSVVNLYERLLPYAVLLGLEKTWGAVIRAQAGDQLAKHAAVLDVVSSPSLHAVSASVSRLAATSERAARAASSSSWSGGSSGWSSSGGSSGGGFSGGGGGGGSIGGR